MMIGLAYLKDCLEAENQVFVWVNKLNEVKRDDGTIQNFIRLRKLRGRGRKI